MEKLLGTDLVVVPNLVAHDASEVDLVRRPTRIPGVRLRAEPEPVDLGTIGGRENLAQALLLRLLTPRGSLAALGHGEYGSRLHELIGQRKTEATRHLCRAFILEVVAQEPRVENKAVEVVFDPQAEGLSSFVVRIAVQPKAGGEPLSLSLEVGL